MCILSFLSGASIYLFILGFLGSFETSTSVLYSDHVNTKGATYFAAFKCQVLLMKLKTGILTLKILQNHYKGICMDIELFS